MIDIITPEMEKRLLGLPNVVGYSGKLQKKIVQGKQIQLPCIRVYVEKKLPPSKLKISDLIPAEILVKKYQPVGLMYKSVTISYVTDVVETGKFRALFRLPIPKQVENERTERARPAIAGISTGHPSITAGTLGQPCIDEQFKHGWLSNWHIFKGFQGFINDRVLQPGTYDDGEVPDDELATLRYGIDIVKEGVGVNEIDAAFASVLNSKDWSDKIARKTLADLFVCQGETEIIQGDQVFYTGRTSPYGEGLCTDDDAAVRVDYGRFPAVYNALFYHQLMLSLDPNILGGNSGSPLYKFGDLFGGLLYAGSQTSAIACKWNKIKEHWKKLYNANIQVATGEAPPPPPPKWEVVYEDKDARLMRKLG